jgi:hypothetical protein
MTHPTYSQTTLEALPTAQLKTIASQIGAIPDGDKRVKQTWISAIIDHQTMFSPVKVAAMEAHIETVMNRLEPTPADESAEVLSITPIEVHTENLSTTPIEIPQQTTPLLIPLLSIALIVLMSIAIVPALVLSSIVLVLGQPQRGITPTPKPICSTT